MLVSKDKETVRLYHEAFHAYVGTFVYPPLRPEDATAAVARMGPVLGAGGDLVASNVTPR